MTAMLSILHVPAGVEEGLDMGHSSYSGQMFAFLVHALSLCTAWWEGKSHPIGAGCGVLGNLVLAAAPQI